MGASKLSEPFHMVLTQLKILTPVGTAMRIVAYMKKRFPASGIPVVYMWWAQTMKDRNAIPTSA